MTEVVDCGDGGWLMADGAKSQKNLARTLFLVFGGKTIGMYPLSPSTVNVTTLAVLCRLDNTRLWCQSFSIESPPYMHAQLSFYFGVDFTIANGRGVIDHPIPALYVLFVMYL